MPADLNRRPPASASNNTSNKKSKLDAEASSSSATSSCTISFGLRLCARLRGNWSNLPTDLVCLIAGKLSLAGRVCLAAVCKPWYSAVAAHRPPILPHLHKKPYLLAPPGRGGPGCGAHGGRRSTTLLVDIAPSACPSPPLPLGLGFGFDSKVVDFLFSGDKWCVGSQFGWLAVVDRLSNPSLVNPFTGSQIHLPPITTLRPFIEPVFHDRGSSISGYRVRHPQKLFWNGECTTDSSLERFRFSNMLAFKKIIFSCNPSLGSFAVLALSHHRHLMYTKAGQDKWSFLHLHNSYYKTRLSRRRKNYTHLLHANDIIYSESHLGAKFLLLRNPDNKVLAIDADLSDASIMTPAVAMGLGLNHLAGLLQVGEGSILTPNVTSITEELEQWLLGWDCYSKYLVEHPGDGGGGVLLQVIRSAKIHYPETASETASCNLFKTFSFQVYKYDEKEAKWIPIDSGSGGGLGCHSLIVGSCHSLSFDARDAPGFRPNCIYFSDIPGTPWMTNPAPFASRRLWMKTAPLDVGVYDIQSASIATINLPTDKNWSIWPRPLWIIPSGLPHKEDSNLQDACSMDTTCTA